MHSASDNSYLVVGIDMGSSSIKASIMCNGLLFPVNMDETVTLSPYIYIGDDNILFDETAYNHYKVGSRRVINYSKQLLGYDVDDIIIEQEKRYNPLLHIEKRGEKVYYEVKDNYFSLNLSCVEVASLLLRNVYNKANSAYNGTIECAVIGVPTWYDTYQRDDIVKAARIAGYKKVHLICEQCACILPYIFSKKVPMKKCLVYDFGGTCLDIVLVGIENDKYTVLNSAHDSQNCGRTISEKVYGMVVELLSIQKVEVDEHDTILREQCNQILNKLIYNDDSQKISYKGVTVTIVKNGIKAILDECIKKSNTVVNQLIDIKRNPGIDMILMGCLCNSNYVKKCIKKEYGSYCTIHCEQSNLHACANGALLYGISQNYSSTYVPMKIQLLDRLSSSVYLQYDATHCCKLFGNVIIPSTIHKRVVVDEIGESIMFCFYQGFHTHMQKNALIDKVIIQDASSLIRQFGSLHFDTVFDIDSNGIISLKIECIEDSTIHTERRMQLYGYMLSETDAVNRKKSIRVKIEASRYYNMKAQVYRNIEILSNLLTDDSESNECSNEISEIREALNKDSRSIDLKKVNDYLLEMIKVMKK